MVQVDPNAARKVVFEALIFARGNVSAAAEDAFGINKRTLQRYIKDLDLQRDLDRLRRDARLTKQPRWRSKKR